MEFDFPITNKTMELSDCREAWFFDETYGCWCLEDVLYTPKAAVPKFQRLSIFVPKAYMRAPGELDPAGADGRFTTRTAPVVFENNSAGYMQMPHTWLGGPRDEAGKYLARGMVYVTCGCRGRESRDAAGRLCGKSPWPLVDLKTAIRFLRHNRAALPGDFDRIVSVGWSAGGAMSALVGVTGDNAEYAPYLAENGAFTDESDEVFAAQVYCPIIDLEHADAAYEWQFRNDPECEDSASGPAGLMTPFQAALSKRLAAEYIDYFNGLELRSPETGEPLRFDAGGRSGSAYDYLLAALEDSAADFLGRLTAGRLPLDCGVADYLSGNYTRKVRPPRGPGKRDGDALRHHAGADVALPPEGEAQKPKGPPSLGDMVSRPPKGVPYKPREFPMADAPGDDKRAWLRWDGARAEITGLDDYLLGHRRRMKPCPAFDALNATSPENGIFGTPERDSVRFSPAVRAAIEALRTEFPEEAARYQTPPPDAGLEKRVYLLNPMNFAGNPDGTRHYRIRVGACDADTAFSVSMALALKLANAGKDVSWALVWDQPHAQADYPGEVCGWIEEIW